MGNKVHWYKIDFACPDNTEENRPGYWGEYRCDDIEVRENDSTWASHISSLGTGSIVAPNYTFYDKTSFPVNGTTHVHSQGLGVSFQRDFYITGLKIQGFDRIQFDFMLTDINDYKIPMDIELRAYFYTKKFIGSELAAHDPILHAQRIEQNQYNTVYNVQMDLTEPKDKVRLIKIAALWRPVHTIPAGNYTDGEEIYLHIDNIHFGNTKHEIANRV